MFAADSKKERMQSGSRDSAYPGRQIQLSR